MESKTVRYTSEQLKEKKGRTQWSKLVKDDSKNSNKTTQKSRR